MVKPLVPPMVDILGPYITTPQHVVARPGLTGDASGAGFSWWKDCSDENAEDGTPIPAVALNNFKAQLLSLIQAGGGGVDDSDYMTTRAVRSQRLNYTLVSGSPSAFTATLDPALTEYQAGLVLRIVPGAPNNAGVTLDAGPGALPILRLDGSAVERGDIPANVPSSVICTGTAWVLAGLAFSDVRRRLKGDLILYCRPDGNDANDGLEDTPGRALRQPHRALELLRQVYDAAGRAVTVRCADGTYAAPYLDGLTTSSVRVLGNYTTPANVIIDGTTVDFPITMIGASQLKMQGITFAGTKELAISSASMLTLEQCRFANGTGSRPKISATYGAVVSMAVGNSFFNSAESALYAGPNSSIVSSGFIEFSGTPIFSDAVVVANAGYVDVTGGFGGAASGRRYRGSQSGAIYTAGGGASFIPGTVAGLLDATSSYL